LSYIIVVLTELYVNQISRNKTQWDDDIQIKPHTNYHSYTFRHPLFYPLSLFIYIQHILTRV